jgi:hypothetical protein
MPLDSQQHKTLQERRELASRLNALLEDFRFQWGETASRCDGEIDVSVERVWDLQGRLEHLVTVFAGLPSVPGIRGLPWTVRQAPTGQIVRVGQTDRRGQFRLRGLGPGEYRLEIEGLAAGPAVARVSPQCVGAQALGPISEAAWETSEDGLVKHRLRQGAAGFVLETQIVAAVASDRLARYRIWDADNRLLDQGYLGLYVSDEQEGMCAGEILLATELPQRWSPDCHVQVVAQSRQMLTARDRADLEKSLAATEHPACAEVLAVLLQQLPPAERE